MKIPEHIAIIMDGNRRWARQRGLPDIEGHKAGADALEEIVEEAAKIGVKTITVYALSKINIDEANHFAQWDDSQNYAESIVKKDILKMEDLQIKCHILEMMMSERKEDLKVESIMKFQNLKKSILKQGIK